jgi:hypothetical protein
LLKKEGQEGRRMMEKVGEEVGSGKGARHSAVTEASYKSLQRDSQYTCVGRGWIEKWCLKGRGDSVDCTEVFWI